jgi:hypothetical protein
MPKNTEKKSFISKEIMDAAKAIATLKGENLDELAAQFYHDYVYENLHYLTEKVKEKLPEKKVENHAGDKDQEYSAGSDQQN